MGAESRDATGCGAISIGGRLSPIDVAPTAAVLALCVAVFLLAVREPGITAWELVRVVAVVALLLWAPGRLVISALPLRLRGLEALALSLVVGMIVSSVAYAGLVLVGLPSWSVVFWAVGIAIATVARLRPWTAWAAVSVPLLRLEHALLSAVVAVGFLVFASLPYYWGNVVETETGALRLTAVGDVVLHVSLGRELTHEVPPGVPFLSGTPLAYHSGADLVGAMVASLAGVSVADASLRYVPPLFFLMAALATFAFARWWVRSGLGAAFATALVLFGEDLSFIIGLRDSADQLWSRAYFQAPAVFGLYFLNPMLVALAITMAALLATGRWLAGGGLAWLVSAGALIASLWAYKVFVGQLLLATLLVVAVVEAARKTGRASRAAVLAVVGGLLTAPLALVTLVATDASDLTSIDLGPRDYVSNALGAIGLPELGHGVALPTAGLALYLVGNLGMRLVALPGLVSDRFRLSAPPSMRLVLWTFVVLGTVLTLTTRISLEHDPGGSYDNAVWFYTAAKFVLWILAVEVVVALKARRRTAALVLASSMLVLSAPSTVQLVERMRATYEPTEVSPADVRLLRDLDRRCTGDTVVLPTSQLIRPMLLVTDCETPTVGYDELYSRSLLSASELDARVRDIATFWRRWQDGICAAAVLERYEVAYVVASAAGRAPARCGSRRLFRVLAAGPHATFAASSSTATGRRAS